MNYLVVLLAVLVFAGVHGENEKKLQKLNSVGSRLREFEAIVQSPESTCTTGRLCTETCFYTNDGDCDDGGEYSDYSVCQTGSDCKDCGVRVCSDTCQYSSNGRCDDGGDGSQTSLCEWGTDCTDCKGRAPWRADNRCGSSYPMPNGDLAECNPNGVHPCCSNIGWCGNSAAHCTCSGCTDYSVRRWRDDGRCGSGYPLSDGSPAECNPHNPSSHCCSSIGWCGNTPDHCTCSGCTDFCGKNTCEHLRIISRSEWGARSPTNRNTMTTPVDFTFIHHTAGSRCFDQSSCSATMRSTQNLHMDTNRWSDIGYSFCIGEDGNAYEGRGWGVVGAHTFNYNSVSHGFAYFGNFDSILPNESALNAGQQLIDCGLKQNYIKSNYRLLGHRDASATVCPGQTLYNEIKTWPRFG